MTDQAKQTPLIELLTAVPEDVGIGVQDGEDWHAGTTWHPVGRLCREAAAELRRLHAENAELLEALRLVTIDCNNFHHGHKDRHALGEDCPVAARISAAIAKAEEQK